MKIKALMPFSNGKISMEQYEVKDVDDTLGAQLVAAGVAIEIGGSSGGGVLVVHATEIDDSKSANTKSSALPTPQEYIIDKTWQEIADADAVRIVYGDFENGAGSMMTGIIIVVDEENQYYGVYVAGSGQEYYTDSASGYPRTHNGTAEPISDDGTWKN